MGLPFRLSLNLLFIFVIVSVVLDYSGQASPPVLFFTAALAILPIARLIVLATEQLSMRTGDAVGGLLNATFGNAPELIIGIVALKAGLLDMVRASLIGAILANLLLALGIAFLLGGWRHHIQRFSATAAQAYGSMMLVAVISLGVPSAFSRVFAPDSMIREEALLNVGAAIVLLVAYGLYLVFSLKTHPDFFKSVDSEMHVHGVHKQWSVSRAIGSLIGASVLAAWMSEILVGAAEGTGEALGMSQKFIGVVLVAIVGGAAESGSAIAVAIKNKVDLTIGIALGSSIQIALFVAPVFVLVSYLVAPVPLELSFSRGEIGTLFLAILIGTAVISDGCAHWYKGVQLITVYTIIALMFYFVPKV
jgi:Ca2+:H+ antiporter